MAGIQVGDRAPEITLATHTGEEISLAGYRGRQAVVLFFYPRDGTPVCTKEACSFRDAYEDFLAAGAAVIGVSSDSADRHQAFAAGHRLPFPLVSDKDGAVRRAFGVPKTMGFLPGRVTYVIDKEGTVRHVFSSQFAADRHVQEALEIVRGLDR
jgi:peroxiredoxin Q/BCP